IHAAGINAYDYIARLEDLRKVARSEAGSIAVPDLDRQIQIELQLDRSIISGTPTSLEGARGAVDTMVPVSSGFSDPIAVYVPQSPAADGRYRIAVLLHGAGETEADVVSRDVFERLAESQHAILIAPWAAGDNLWGQRSIDEIFLAVERVEKALSVDTRRTYLVGISMGGAGVFHVAATHADRFTAFMAIVGDLAGDDARSVRVALRDKNVYLVQGGHDSIMGPRANSYTYGSLARACIPVSLYVSPEAGHSLYETAPEVRQAWNDMFAGIVRNGSSSECTPSVTGPN
ncbi:MAG: prolyl oligopeptidase family serine peptidase, partial [Candidatus Eremiobacteraeota bacterium]|nr:prolyl oligopeptidase family serine peptidase [Candidatus Eremiobacteraeota bacterium]